MKMNFPDLDETTRGYMLRELEAELKDPGRYIIKSLNESGLARFPDFLRAAIGGGNEQTLTAALLDPAYWRPHFKPRKDGKVRERNIPYWADRLALTEFNTWYVRGLSKRLLDEGV